MTDQLVNPAPAGTTDGVLGDDPQIVLHIGGAAEGTPWIEAKVATGPATWARSSPTSGLSG